MDANARICPLSGRALDTISSTASPVPRRGKRPMNIFGKRTLVVLAGGVCLASGILAAQTGFKRPGTLPPADAPASAPAAITGLPSSARHCVSGDAANVHAIGWFDVGTSYTIRFDSDIELATALG